jgi:transposase-like protein
MREYQKQSEKARVAGGRALHKRLRRVRQHIRAEGSSTLEAAARAGAQRQIQDVLGEERETFLEREPHERVAAGEFRGYRNGFGQERRLTLGLGQIAVRMPRVRDNDEPFESKLVRKYQRTGDELLAALPDLYLCGISLGDFREALKCLLGTDAGLSPASIVRLKEKWVDEYQRFREQTLASHYAYIWADGTYLRSGADKDKLAVLAVIGVDSEGRKQLLALIAGLRESKDDWLGVFRDLHRRGVRWIGLVVADGIPTLWLALAEVFPDAGCQRDWVHKIGNVLEKLPREKQAEARATLRKAYGAQTREEAVNWLVYFADRYRAYPPAVECLLKDQNELLTFFNFPKEHWRHIRTSNPVESPFARVKGRVQKAKRIVRFWSAMGLTYQLLMLSARRWRRLDAAELAAEVVAGAKYRNGVRVKAPDPLPAALGQQTLLHNI